MKYNNATKSVNESITSPCTPFTHITSTDIAVTIKLIEEVFKKEILTTNALLFIEKSDKSESMGSQTRANNNNFTEKIKCF